MMLPLAFLVLDLHVLVANAAVFTSPILPNGEAVSRFFARDDSGSSVHFKDVFESRRLRARGQFPLESDHDVSASERHRVELWDGPPMNPYLVPAAIGNPPQPFRLLIDLAWDELIVPSADCKGDCDDDYDPKLKFYSNESSTYSVLEDYNEIVYGTDRFIGDLATDTFRIAGIEVNEQPFLNAYQANPMGFLSFYDGYDGVLGLAPRFNHIQTTGYEVAPSPWFNMVNHSLLDANVFALELPHGLQHWIDIARWGELSFGGISPKYAQSNFSHLPLSTYSDQVWAVEAQSITWENETHPIHVDFANFTLAGFDTTTWFIALPGDLPSQIYASVEHQCGGFSIFCSIDCLQRNKMPNLTFGIGGGTFTITPYDYVIEVEGPAKQRVCFFDIWPSENMGYPVDAIVLGKPFMQAFYSVFDLDEMEIRLTERID